MTGFTLLSQQASDILYSNHLAYGDIHFYDLNDIIKSMNSTIHYIQSFNGCSPIDEDKFDPDVLYNKNLLNDNYRKEQILSCEEVINKANNLMNRVEIKLPASISQISISPLSESRNGAVAMAKVTIEDSIIINSITIREKNNGSGYYVKMPQKKTTDGNFFDVAHPLSAETRKAMNKAILDMYSSGCFSCTNNAVFNPVIKAQNCFKFRDLETSRSLARLDIKVNDFVVHNAKIVNTDDGNTILSLPIYKDKSGDYHSIIIPKSPEAFKKLNEAALTEFNTEYNYLKSADIDVKALKDAKIDFQSVRTSDGNTLIKFKADDNAAVQNALKSIQKNLPKLP